MNCPRCSRVIKEGQTACSANGCAGAEEDARRPLDRELEPGKGLRLSLNIDYVFLVRLAAVLIVVLAGLVLYFSGRP